MKERNKGAECCRFGKCLPETIKHICGLPKEPDEFRNHKPHNPARCIKLLAHPDPPDSTCATIRGWLRYHSPNFFSDGAIKEGLKAQKAVLMAWRKHALRYYCKQNNLSISSFPDPVEPNEAVFAPFGPKHNLLEKIDRIMRANDLSLGWIIKAFGRAPEIFVFEKGRLSLLLKNLKAVERELKHYFPGAMIAVNKSRAHPTKQAYSIRIVSHLMLNELISPLFTHPEILTFNIEIVAASIKGPPILCYWFDLPKSFVMAQRSLPLVDFVKDRMKEMIRDIDEHCKWIFLQNTTDIEAKVSIPYGPFNLKV